MDFSPVLNFIDGNWVAPQTADHQPVIDPVTETALGELHLSGPADVDLAVQAARRAFPSWSAVSREDRGALLTRVIGEVEARQTELAGAISHEIGAPALLARNVHAAVGLVHLKIARRVLRDYAFSTMRGTTQIVHEPIGVCGLIVPWNWPINQIAAKVAPALATGCTIVMKPSEQAPYSARIFAEALEAAGVPPGVFNLVNGTGPVVGSAIAAHSGVDLVSITGSTAAGIDVARTAASTVKRVHQELGGKSANIIVDDGRFAEGVANGVRQTFVNSGQSCNAPTRMLVPAHRMEQACEIAMDVANATRVGAPDDAAVDIGPVASLAQWLRIQNLIASGIEEGASLIAGGLGRPTSLEKGYYVRPTVFGGVKNTMRIAREEIFGPVLSILAYDDLDDAVAIANQSEYGIAAYVWAQDHALALSLGARLRAGQIVLNAAGPDPMAPFGGYRMSGNGREWGDFAFHDFLETKALLGASRS